MVDILSKTKKPNLIFSLTQSVSLLKGKKIYVYCSLRLHYSLIYSCVFFLLFFLCVCVCVSVYSEISGSQVNVKIYADSVETETIIVTSVNIWFVALFFLVAISTLRLLSLLSWLTLKHWKYFPYLDRRRGDKIYQAVCFWKGTK